MGLIPSVFVSYGHLPIPPRVNPPWGGGFLSLYQARAFVIIIKV